MAEHSGGVAPASSSVRAFTAIRSGSSTPAPRANPLAEAPNGGGVQPAGLAEEALVGGQRPLHRRSLSLTEPKPTLPRRPLPGEVLQHQYPMLKPIA